MLYAALAEAGYFGRDHLATLRKLGSILQGHPDSKKTPGVEVSTGSLGQGLSIACGLARACAAATIPRTSPMTARSSACSATASSRRARSGRRRCSPRTRSSTTSSRSSTTTACRSTARATRSCASATVAAKFRAFGWNVTEIDGHDLDAIHDALEAAKAYTAGPSVIVAHTIKGKGVSFMEGEAGWHGKAPSPEQVAAALVELGMTEGSQA